MTQTVHSEIRGPGLLSRAAVLEYRALRAGQPLVLTRDPTNRADPWAIVALTGLLQPTGYVAREHAAVVAPEMDAGVLWLAQVTSRADAFSYPKIVLEKDTPQARRDFKRVFELWAGGGRDQSLMLADIFSRKFAREYLQVD
jgi:hypothetical protein